MDKEKIRDIFYEYELLRAENEEDLEKRKKETYEKYPEVEKMDREITLFGLEMTKAALGKKFSDDDFKSLQNRMEDLVAKKRRLLEDIGIDESYLEMKYHCSKCKDTGFLENGKRCDCLIKKKNKELYRISNIEKKLKTQNFNNFNLNIFSDEKDPVNNISQRDNIKTAIKYAYNFVESSQKGIFENLLFYGPTGTGKTFLCSCIADALLKLDTSVLYVTSHQLVQIIKDYKFSNAYEDNSLQESKFRNLFDIDILIIDDLGTEFQNQFTVSEIFNLINERILGEKNTVISTNLTPKDLILKYDERIASRILGYYKAIMFFGKDLRINL